MDAETPAPGPAKPDAKPEPPRTGADVESVRRDAARQLVVTLKGRPEPAVNARAARCFPWSRPEEYVSLLDSAGHELALVKSLDELDPESRAIVLEELRDKIFNPRIRRVLGDRDEFGVVSITAETDRGTVTFQIRSRDDVRILSPTRALFRDADGNTYELADLRALDAAGRRALGAFF